MPLFIMATRLATGSLESPKTLETWERIAVGTIRSERLQVEWIASYATLGPYDYIDIFEAASNDEAMQVAALIRTFGHSHTEVWPATPWDHFKDLIRQLPVDRGEEACGWTRG
jgi:uncharacterized protein with GYD domain